MRVSKVAIINLALVLCFLAFVEGGDVSSIITPSLFKEMLKHRNDPQCEAKGFYTYHAFITAANYFSKFGTTGDINVRKRELAAFFAQTSHETTGGWATAPDGPYAWGYCKKKENDRGNNFCDESTPAGAKWPCVPGRKYYGRGPMQISYNYNYGPAGRAINEDLLSHPGLVDKDPVISFKTAIWFWMTPQGPKPSCHDVITNNRLLTELLEELQDLVSSPTSSTGDWNVVRGTAPLKQRTRGTVGCLEWTLDRTWLAVTKGPSLKPCSLLQSRLWACRSSGGSKGLQDLVSSLISSIGASACAHLGLTLSLPA